MITDSIKCIVSALVILAGTTGCASRFAERCLQRQQRGNVFFIEGDVAPGGTAAHKVLYGTDGSQNDIKIKWAGQWNPGGPRLKMYATLTKCTNAAEVGNSGSIRLSPQVSPPCAGLGTRGGMRIEGEFVQTSLTIANGRGNPDILGSPAEYKLWIFGDPDKSIHYTIESSYFYGPDC